jgi:hypothetical protein
VGCFDAASYLLSRSSRETSMNACPPTYCWPCEQRRARGHCCGCHWTATCTHTHILPFVPSREYLYSKIGHTSRRYHDANHVREGMRTCTVQPHLNNLLARPAPTAREHGGGIHGIRIMGNSAPEPTAIEIVWPWSLSMHYYVNI